MTCSCGKPATISVYDELHDNTREVCDACAHAILRDAVGTIGAGFEVAPGRVVQHDPEAAYAATFTLDFADRER